jgi:8-oxo-dGTP diphosphatase
MTKTEVDNASRSSILIERNDNEEWKRKIVTPRVGVAAIVESCDRSEIAVIDRKYPPYGIAFPGGFMNIGETTVKTGKREVEEETGLIVNYVGILNTTSDPFLDPRMHLVVIAIVCRDIGETDIFAGDDAKNAFWISLDNEDLNFTPRTFKILNDYRKWRSGEGYLIGYYGT